MAEPSTVTGVWDVLGHFQFAGAAFKAAPKDSHCATIAATVGKVDGQFGLLVLFRRARLLGNGFCGELIDKSHKRSEPKTYSDTNLQGCSLMLVGFLVVGVLGKSGTDMDRYAPALNADDDKPTGPATSLHHW